MIITASTNDQLMVMAAHRYCLGRSSYIVGACIDWLTDHWKQISISTQNIIFRDTIQAILNNHAGMDLDKRCWLSFIQKHWGGLSLDSKRNVESSIVVGGKSQVEVLQSLGVLAES